LDCIGQISQPMRSPNTSPLVAGRDQISLSPPSSEPHRKRASSEEHHRKRPSDQGAPIKNPMAIPPSDASDQGCPQMRRCRSSPLTINRRGFCQMTDSFKKDSFRECLLSKINRIPKLRPSADRSARRQYSHIHLSNRGTSQM